MMLMQLHNHHVYLYFRWLRWVAEQDRRYFAQFLFYTLAELELDPDCKPEHLSKDGDA